MVSMRPTLPSLVPKAIIFSFEGCQQILKTFKEHFILNQLKKRPQTNALHLRHFAFNIVDKIFSNFFVLFLIQKLDACIAY